MRSVNFILDFNTDQLCIIIVPLYNCSKIKRKVDKFGLIIEPIKMWADAEEYHQHCVYKNPNG